MNPGSSSDESHASALSNNEKNRSHHDHANHMVDSLFVSNDPNCERLLSEPQFSTNFSTDENNQPFSIITTEDTRLRNEATVSNTLLPDSIPTNKEFETSYCIDTEINKSQPNGNDIECVSKNCDGDKSDRHKENQHSKLISDKNNLLKRNENDAFDSLVESNVDDVELNYFNVKTQPNSISNNSTQHSSKCFSPSSQTEDNSVIIATQNFLSHEISYCQSGYFLPFINDIKFSGPSEEIVDASFKQNNEDIEEDKNLPLSVTHIIKEWETDSDSNTTNSSSGEFIWKQQAGGAEPSTDGEDHREMRQEQDTQESVDGRSFEEGASGDEACDGSENSCSEVSETEFVPSSWDCRAAPAKSSLRDHLNTPDSKKRVAFKREKYQCVYEYPREPDDGSPAACAPDLSTYADWDTSYAAEAEAGYGRLFGSPGPLDLYQFQAGSAYPSDYDEDFFISSSTRPFESLGVMSTVSQFFPGMHSKQLIDVRDEIDQLPSLAMPSPLLPPGYPPTKSLDFTTPDSGVEDITPGSTNEELSNVPSQCWKMVDSTSSSESVSPGSPGEVLGGLRHTRDKLKLDLPPSPHVPSPKQNRVFSFVLDKPKRQKPVADEAAGENVYAAVSAEALEIASGASSTQDRAASKPEVTFSTFGKCLNVDDDQKNVVDANETGREEETKIVESVKGEGNILDSGDEDSGIESSSKATLKASEPAPNVS